MFQKCCIHKFVRGHYAKIMRIPRIDSLPDVAQRAEWARLLRVDASTLYRADMAGQLRGSKPGGRIVLYSKKAILRWLGIEK
jgi:hypothetical protein